MGREPSSGGNCAYPRNRPPRAAAAAGVCPPALAQKLGNVSAGLTQAQDHLVVMGTATGPALTTARYPRLSPPVPETHEDAHHAAPGSPAPLPSTHPGGRTPHDPPDTPTPGDDGATGPPSTPTHPHPTTPGPPPWPSRTADPQPRSPDTPHSAGPEWHGHTHGARQNLHDAGRFSPRQPANAEQYACSSCRQPVDRYTCSPATCGRLSATGNDRPSKSGERPVFF